jgi:hypothetical protein
MVEVMEVVVFMSIRELLMIEHKFKTLTILQSKLQQPKDEIFGMIESIQVTQDQLLPKETEAANFDRGCSAGSWSL